MVDHLVYASPDLDRGIDAIEALLGARAAPGGSHPQWGTRNALLALGPGVYLEIIAPDPALARPDRGYPFGINALDAPKLVTWAIKCADIDAVTEDAREGGYDPGPAIDGARALPSGDTLRWRLTRPQPNIGGGLIPFLIDWRDSPHPSTSLPSGGRLVALKGQHPNPARVSAALDALGVRMPVTHGQNAKLSASIESSGRIVVVD